MSFFISILSVINAEFITDETKVIALNLLASFGAIPSTRTLVPSIVMFNQLSSLSEVSFLSSLNVFAS